MGLSQKPRREPDDPFPFLWDDLVHYTSHLNGGDLGLPPASLPSSVANREVLTGSLVEEADPTTTTAPLEGAGPATATLGRLLEDQGHTGEAEEVYAQVLWRRPSNRAAAQELLGRVRRKPWPLQARDLLLESAGHASLADANAPSGAESGSELRSHLLQRYVDRLRSGDR